MTIGSSALRRFAGLAFAFAGMVAAACATAQNYPDKPIRIIVPFAPGGGSDVVGRLIAQKLNARWKQPVIVENRPGAGGAIGADMVAKAMPDGYTLLLSDSSAVTMNPALYPNLPYAARDLIPVAKVATFSLVLLVPANSSSKSVDDIVAMDKAKPGSLSAGSAGPGTSPHLTLELMNSVAGTRLTHVPYRGGGPALIDLIGGQLDLTFSGVSANTMQIINNGKVKALAVTASTRLASLPDVPTVAESGFPGFEAISAQTLFAPAGTPPKIVNKLNAEVSAILRLLDVVELWAQMGHLPVTDENQEQLAAWFAKESVKWSSLIRKRNIKAD